MLDVLLQPKKSNGFLFAQVVIPVPHTHNIFFSDDLVATNMCHLGMQQSRDEIHHLSRASWMTIVVIL